MKQEQYIENAMAKKANDLDIHELQTLLALKTDAENRRYVKECIAQFDKGEPATFPTTYEQDAAWRTMRRLLGEMSWDQLHNIALTYLGKSIKCSAHSTMRERFDRVIVTVSEFSTSLGGVSSDGPRHNSLIDVLHKADALIAALHESARLL